MLDRLELNKLPLPEDSKDLPQAIEDIEMYIALYTEQIDQMRETMEQQEEQAMVNVVTALQSLSPEDRAAGKNPKPLYSNDKARETAVHKMLLENHYYQQAKSYLSDLIYSRAVLHARLGRLKRAFDHFTLSSQERIAHFNDQTAQSMRLAVLEMSKTPDHR